MRLVVANAGSAVAIYLASQLGLLAGEIGGNVSPLWPPTGVGVAALLIFGLRVLPGIVVAELIIEFSLHIPLVPALVSATGSSLAMVTAFALLRWVGFRPALDRLRDALTLVLLGAFVAMLVSSTIGTSMRLVAGQVTWSEFWPVWWVWWTGDAMGVLLLTPLLLSLWRFRPAVRRARTVPWYRWVEAAVLLVGAFVVVLVGVRTLGVLFLAFPFIGWAALRFQLAGAAPCALVVSLIGVYASMEGYGEFAGQDVLSRMVILQLFNGLVVLGSLLLATIITQRNIARGDIAHTYERLTDVIQHLEDQEPQAPEVEPTRYGHGRKEQDDES